MAGGPGAARRSVARTRRRIAERGFRVNRGMAKKRRISVSGLAPFGGRMGLLYHNAAEKAIPERGSCDGSCSGYGVGDREGQGQSSLRSLWPGAFPPRRPGRLASAG